MPLARLSAAKLTEHLITETPAVRATVRALRRTVLKAAPAAVEAMKFHVLCYFHADAYFGAIGGNICLIETKADKAYLSFIHGSKLPDPSSLLRGKGKFKRFLHIPDPKFAASREVVALIRAAAALKPWDEGAFD